jgi:hypothetical protein
MNALPIPETLTIYQLVKQNGMYFMSTGISGGYSIGSGFFMTRNDAEMQRTMESLKSIDNSVYHVFELTIPNPAYKK